MKSNFSLRFRILALCSLFLLPIVFLLYQLTTAVNKDLDFSKAEITGIKFLSPLVELLSQASDHHQSYLDGSVPKAKADELNAAIDATMDKVKSAFETHGGELKFTTSELAKSKMEKLTFDTLASDWAAIKNSSDASKLDDAHKTFIADIRGVLAHAGDTSNITLDPEFDSYYVGDAIVNAIPQNMDRLNQIESSLRGWAKSFPKTANVAAAVFSGLMHEADVDHAGGDISTALNAHTLGNGKNEILLTKLVPAFNTYKTTATSLLDGLDALKDSASASKIVPASIATRHEVLALWHLAAESFSGLINTRIDKDQAKQNTALVTSAILVLFMTVFSYFSAGKITKSLERFVDDVAQEAKVLASVSDLMDSALQDAAMATTEQSAAVEQTVSSMEEMTAMLGQTSQNASEAASEAKQSTDEVYRGKTVLTNMLASMREISVSNEKLQAIVRVIEDIKSKTTVINDIAFETRLLSFNASIEAARAGAHGRGFAVVAEEVGKLANVSNKAADEVRILIDNSVAQVNGVLDETRRCIEQGQVTSSACSETFERMQSSIGLISDGMTRIESATREQNAGVQEANKAMKEMEKVSQISASNGAKITKQSAQLRSIADMLQKNASAMYHLVLGRNSQDTSSASDKSDSGNTNGTSKKWGRRSAQEGVNSEVPIHQLKSESLPGHSVNSAAKVGRNDSRWDVA